MESVQKKVALSTLGCKLNITETSTISRSLSKNGYVLTPFSSKADFYIINTCSVTENADKKFRTYLNKAKKLNPKAKRISFEGTYNAKASYLPKEEGIIFVHRSDDGLFHIALKYKRENFIRILTEAKMDESPSVAPNGNMVIYGIKEENLSMLAGFSLSGAKFKLPASNGEVREPAWSNFLR